jgi:glutamate racemase
MGPGVQVIDSGVAIARRVRAVLDQHGLLTESEGPGALTLMTSGDASVVEPVVRLLLDEPAPVTTVATTGTLLERA